MDSSFRREFQERAHLYMTGQATTGWFRTHGYNTLNRSIKELPKNAKAKGATRVVIRLNKTAPIPYLDIVDNGRGQSFEQVTMFRPTQIDLSKLHMIITIHLLPTYRIQTSID